MRKMARLRYIENARTGDAGSVVTHDNKLFFDDTGAYINASASGTLDLVATTIAITGNLTVSGSIAKAGTEIPTATTYLGPLTVGVNDLGHDVIFYGATSGSYWMWDQSGDEVIIVGAFGQTGNMDITGTVDISSTLDVVGTTVLAALTSVGAVSLTGTVAINGAVTMETTDAINFYDTGASIQASSQNTLALTASTLITIAATNMTLTGIVAITGATTLTGNVDIAGSNTFTVGTGAITLQGAIGTTKAITISPTAAGTFLDFELEDEWVSGTLIDADFGIATTLNNDVIGMELDFNGNITMTTDKDVTGHVVKLPALTQSAANTTLITGFDIVTAGALVQDTTAGTITWKGINIQLPNTTATTGTVNSYGVYITAGTVTSGSQYGLYFPTGTLTTAIALAGTCTDGIVFSGTISDEAIQIGGTYDHGIRFTEDPVAGDVTNSFINVGDYTTGIAVAPTSANMFGVMHNVTLAVNVAYWYQAYYTKITTSGTTTSTSIAGHALRMVIGSNLAAVYGIQSHVNVSGARTFTSEVTAGSFYLDVGSTTISNAGSRVNALQAVLIGSSAVTCASFAIASFTAATNVSADTLVFIGQNSTCASDVAMEFDLDGTVTNVFEFNGTVCDAFTTADAATEFGAFDEYVLIPVKVEGITPQLYVIAAETWQSVD